jgi:hypothetical protein
MQRREVRNPRCGPVRGLRQALDREEERLGRVLTPEEWQCVRDGSTQRNALIEMGLDFCFIKER